MMSIEGIKQLEICQVCFALNNMAVTLLEKGFFREASKTFKVATSALRTLEQAQRRAINLEETIQILRKRLKKAASRTARESKKNPCDIDISSIDDDDREAMEAAQQYGPTTSIVFPIRLRELPSSKTVQEDLDSQISVVFYNAGIAQLLNYRKARRIGSDEMGQISLNKARRLLTTADAALSRSIRWEGLKSVRIILLASLVLANLSVTYRYQDEAQKVALLDETLFQLERKRLVLERDSIIILKSKLAAAAA